MSKEMAIEGPRESYEPDLETQIHVHAKCTQTLCDNMIAALKADRNLPRNIRRVRRELAVYKAEFEKIAPIAMSTKIREGLDRQHKQVENLPDHPSFHA